MGATASDGDLGTSPTGDPLGYPGDVPDLPFLLDRGRVRELDLRRLDPTLVDDRNLVVVTGSNASPARLVEKLGRDAVVPVLGATARGIEVRYSAHVARYGSVPATAWPVPGASPFLPALVLDDEQLATLDATEPNYDRVRLGEVGAGLMMVAAPIVDVRFPQRSTAFAYLSRRGWYRLDGGSPALPPLAHPSPVRHGTVVTQSEMLAGVLGLARSARPELDLADVAALLDAVRDGGIDLTARELTALLAAEGRASTEGRHPTA